jgi:hypothetical protein
VEHLPLAREYRYSTTSNLPAITPFGMNYNRTIIHDPFLQSLDELHDYGVFSVMFGGGHSLFEMISLISRFTAEQEP